MGDEAVWSEFDNHWGAVLEKHDAPTSGGGSRYFHGKEFFSRKGGYQGWSRKRSRELAADLGCVIFDHFDKRNAVRPDSLRAVTCTVSKDAYERVKPGRPELPAISKICLSDCLDVTMNHPASANGIQLFFDRGSDRNEPYFRHAHALVFDKKASVTKPMWANLVKVCTKINDSREVFAMQAVDMLAWSANRYFTNRADDSFRWRLYMLAIATNLRHSYYDDDGLRSAYDDRGCRIVGTNSPSPPITPGFPDFSNVIYSRSPS